MAPAPSTTAAPAKAADALFKPLKVGDVELKHRIVMAPLTRCRALDSSPNDMMMKYYEQRATEGGLIVTEATYVAPDAVGYPCVPGIITDAHKKGWSNVFKAIHGKGGKVAQQLWHVGRASIPSYQPNGALPVGVSAVPVPKGFQAFDLSTMSMADYVTPRPLETAEIAKYVDYYKRAAANAMEAGADLVEIHGASGYLIEQFLKDSTNHRTDKYGGPIENRVRFALEVVDAVRKEVGNGKTGLRLSPFNDYLMGENAESKPYSLYTYLMEELNSRSLAYVHLVEDREDVPHPKSLDPITKVYQGTVIRASGYTREKAIDAVESGSADLVAFGRHFISTPDLVKRVKLGAKFNDYDRDTFYTQGENGYLDYPTLD